MNIRTFAIEQFGAAIQLLLKDPDVDFVQMDGQTHFLHFEVSVDRVAPQLMRVQLGIVSNEIPIFCVCVVNTSDNIHRLQEITVFFSEAARVPPHKHPFRDDAIPGMHTFVAKPTSDSEFVLLPRTEPSRNIIPEP